MKKSTVFIGGLLFSNLLIAGTNTAITCVPGQPQTSNGYESVKWYRDSAERNAIYREVFLLGENQIQQVVKAQHLKPHQWGVVFDIDETVLDDGAMYQQKVLQCQTMNFTLQDFSAFEVQGIAKATPGGAKITCDIQKMGGYVSLISNRDGGYVDSKTGQNIMAATLKNLKQEGICFDQVILMSKNSDSMDKNPRFTAVKTGVYPANMGYSNTLPKHPVIAYFGDNIQDFPNLAQQDMIKQNPNGSAYDPFGVMYFSLPNPMYGSWQNNHDTQ